MYYSDFSLICQIMKVLLVIMCEIINLKTSLETYMYA